MNAVSPSGDSVVLRRNYIILQPSFHPLRGAGDDGPAVLFSVLPMTPAARDVAFFEAFERSFRLTDGWQAVYIKK